VFVAIDKVTGIVVKQGTAWQLLLWRRSLPEQRAWRILVREQRRPGAELGSPP